MIQGMRDIWGYDAIVLRRYAELLTYTQGKNPDHASMYLDFSQYHKFFKMLRCRFIYTINDGKVVIKDLGETMPKISLIGNYRLIKDRNQIFLEMEKASFDPRRTVILESQPHIAPVHSTHPGTIRFKEISTDQVMISATLEYPSVLLITENYSKGWRAQPLKSSDQKSYTIMPANYIFQAIPLKQGEHHILLEYSPLLFRVGKWISFFSAIVFLIFSIWHFRKRF
jgi:uncharacterized membrane protein YfhO